MKHSDSEAISRQFGTRIRHLRATRGWSLASLAAASGVSRSMLSQIERNATNPTLAVALRIARAFGLDLAELLDAPRIASSVAVIRANDKSYHYRSDKHCRIRTLSPLNLEKDVEFYEIRLLPGGELRSEAHFEGTREFLTVQEGTVCVQSGADSETLGKGDSVSYRADIPHAIRNEGTKVATVFLVDIYR